LLFDDADERREAVAVEISVTWTDDAPCASRPWSQGSS
jgi:hypothetical protein